ncbi:MAG: hypothetical protein M0P66_13615 [Salinivirgaceae bacterium]|nr:hypothetical protein [Salinivirgaceae bacterium]
MTYYCHLDSANNLEDTNLQLYSLRKAAVEWNELVDLINEAGVERVDYLKERLAFITNCFGLSLSQLIGQNSPSTNKNRMEPTSKLFPNLLIGTDFDDVTQENLKSDFEDFLNYYDATRHFGKVKYKSIDELTLAKLDYFRNMTIEIWNLVISKFRKDEGNDIEEFTSISDIVYFEKLTNKPSP